ncbi:MAG: hypothetical protein H0T64_05645 [Pyrinomonadaceae bacterium]|nr:hypothetical protein [Pyrinomonadaceae bacterium]
MPNKEFNLRDVVRRDCESAIKYYKKSLELNPDNTNAVQKLKELAADRDWEQLFDKTMGRADRN